MAIGTTRFNHGPSNEHRACSVRYWAYCQFYYLTLANQPQEHRLLEPTIAGIREALNTKERKKDVLEPS